MGVLQVFSSFFEDDQRGHSSGVVGQVFWAPAPYLRDPPTVIEAKRSSPEEHRNLHVRITSLAQHHFQPTADLPVHSLGKKPGEEMLGVLAKKRPVVVLAQTGVDDIDTLPASEKRLTKSGAGRKTYLVAPFYSVSSMQEPGTFGPGFVRRIRRLQYPHLFCVPDLQKEDGLPRSIIRLDRIFPCHLDVGSKPAGRRRPMRS